MFSVKELYDIKDLLNSLSDDVKYFKDEKCEDAPIVVFNCLKKEDLRIGKLIVKVTQEISDLEMEDLPFE